MAGNDDCVFGRRREVGIGCRDHPVDAAASRVVDEWIDTIPERVSHMDDVCFSESHRDIAVGMCRTVVPEPYRRPIKLQAVLAGEHFAGNAAWRLGEEIVVPILHALDLGKIFSRILLCDDLRARCIEPSIAIGVIEVPMSVDQVSDRTRSEIRESFAELRLRDADTGVDQNLAVWSCQYRDRAS